MKQKLTNGALALAGIGALALGGGAIAGAATDGNTNGSNQQQQQAPPGWSQGQGPGGDPAKMSHGPGEQLLTGDTADKVTAAAKDKVSGATVLRVETDSGSAAYEAHMRKSDGSEVTVLLDKQFNVTGVEQGFGGPGGPGHGGPPPTGNAQ